MSCTVVVPCCGRSSRYPGVRPKYLLVEPTGKLLIQKAVEGLPADLPLLVVVLEEHVAQYGVDDVLFEAFQDRNLTVVTLTRSASQSETVYGAIRKLNLVGPIFIKDSDSLFDLHDLNGPDGFIATASLRTSPVRDPTSKSFVRAIDGGIITRIEEKSIISEDFSVGGYFFPDAGKFSTTFERLIREGADQVGELYVSSIINAQIQQEGAAFHSRPVLNYVDLGTLEDWNHYRSRIATYLIDIDGVLVKNGSQFWEPRWGEAPVIAPNAAEIRRLHQQGNQIILTTARPERYRAVTETQLKRIDLPYDGIVFGLLHARRVLVNDYSSTNPYPTATAINIPRDSNDLKDFL